MTDDDRGPTIAPSTVRNALGIAEPVLSRALAASTADGPDADAGTGADPDDSDAGSAGVPLHRRQDLRAAWTDGAPPRPVVTADQRIDLAAPLVGRGDASQWWYLPRYSLDAPGDVPILSCRIADVPSATAEDVWEGRLTLAYATERRIDDDRWHAVAADTPDAAVDQIPSTLDRVELRLPYLDANDELATEAIDGAIDPATNRVAFDLTDDFLKIAYATLASPADDPGARPSIVFYAAFEGWDDLGALDGPAMVQRFAGMANAAALGTTAAAASGRPDAVAMGLAGGASSFVAARAPGVGQRWSDLDLGNGFDAPPVVLASVQTAGTDATVGVRLRNRSPTAVDAMLEPATTPTDDGRQRHRGRARRGSGSTRRPERVPSRRGGDAKRRRGRSRARRGGDVTKRRRRRNRARVRDHRDRTNRPRAKIRDHRRDRDRKPIRRDHRRDRSRKPKRRDHRGRSGSTRRVGPETLGYVGLPTGPIRDASGTQIGETAVVRVAQADGSQWHTESIDGDYDAPVVLAQLMTYEGKQPCHVRLKSVSGGAGGAFAFQLEEWDALDGRHAEEAVGFVVLESGRHELLDGRTVEVGSVGTDHEWAACGVGPFDVPPVVVSHSQTANGHQAVVTQHRSVAQTGFEVRLGEEPGNDGWHATETVGYAVFDTAPPTYDRTLFVVEQPVAAGFDCEDHPHAYVRERDGGGNDANPTAGDTVSFGCAPPWSDAGPVGPRWRQLHPEWVPASVALFESRVEPDTFLVVPDAFVIARNEESHAPAMMLLQAPDPVGDESLVQFEFTVAPALTPFERRFVEQRLYEHTRRVDGEPRRPTVLLPGDVHGLPQSFAWADDESATVNYSPFADGYTFTISYERLSRAALAIEALTAEQGQLTGELTYQLAEETTASSTVALDLNRTTGSALSARLDGGTVALVNECESPVTVEKLLFFTDGAPGCEAIALGEPLVVAPGDTETVAVVLPDDVAGAAASTAVAPHYTIREEPSATLAERKIDVARLTVQLSVTTNLDPAARSIERIAVAVRFAAADEQESCDLVPGDDGFADASQVLRFRLPLDSYLRPEDRVVAYQATVSFTDDRADHVTAWTDHELTESAHLHLTADALGLDDLGPDDTAR